MKLDDIVVEVGVSTRSVSRSTAEAVLELVFQGFAQEVPLWKSRLDLLPDGTTETPVVYGLWGHEFITTLVVVNRTVQSHVMEELVDKSVKRVMLKIGDTVGMALVENVVLSTTKLVGSVGDKVAGGVHAALAAARKKLLGE